MNEDSDPLGDGETVYATSPDSGNDTEDRDWPDHTDPEWLHFAYHILGMSQGEMGREVGISQQAIGKRMNKHGVETRGGSESTGGHEKLDDEDYLRKEYSRGKSLKEIGDELDVSDVSVLRSFRKFGIETRSRSEAIHLAMEQKYDGELYRDKEWLGSQYEDKTAIQIAGENGWSEWVVYDWLDKHGIETTPGPDPSKSDGVCKSGDGESSERKSVVKGEGGKPELNYSWTPFHERPAADKD